MDSRAHALSTVASASASDSGGSSGNTLALSPSWALVRGRLSFASRPAGLGRRLCTLRLAVEISRFVHDSDILERFKQSVDPVFVTCEKTITPVHLQFALCHQLGFLDLVLGQLDGSGLVGCLLLLRRACSLGLLFLVSLLVIIGGLLGTRLLSKPILHLIDRVLLQFFAYLLFFALPLILDFVRAFAPVLSNRVLLRLVFAILGHELEVK